MPCSASACPVYHALIPVISREAGLPQMVLRRYTVQEADTDI